jgi:hypothetical protein
VLSMVQKPALKQHGRRPCCWGTGYGVWRVTKFTAFRSSLSLIIQTSFCLGCINLHPTGEQHSKRTRGACPTSSEHSFPSGFNTTDHKDPQVTGAHSTHTISWHLPQPLGKQTLPHTLRSYSPGPRWTKARKCLLKAAY